jgi:Domain of unknown function (DUF4386)
MEQKIENNQVIHHSPPPGIIAVVYVLLFAAGLIASSLMTSGAADQNPYNSIEQLQTYYTQFPDGMRVTRFFLLASMFPLGIFTVMVVSRLLFHRINVTGVYIALFGGIAAAMFIGISGLCGWVLSQPGVVSEVGAMRVAQLLNFASGGFGHDASLGLLLAGISVPCLFAKLIPKWIGWLGLVTAAVCELSLLSMLFPQLSLLLPLARFPALIWMIAVGFTLPNKRQNATESWLNDAPLSSSVDQRGSE